MNCPVGHRGGSDQALLCLWPVAVAPMRHLAWEPPYAVGVALKKKKRITRSRKNIQDHLAFKY